MTRTPTPGDLDFGRDYYPAMADHYRTGRI